MKKKMKSKLIAAVMSLAMVFTMMPMMGSPVYADDPAPPAPGITQGSDVLSVGSNKSGAATVYCGTTAENPVAWRVIGYGVGTQQNPQIASSADTMTLIAADNLKTDVQFNPGSNSVNTYKDSNLYNEVNALTDDTNGLFSKGEKAGIVARDLAKGGYTDQEPYTNGIAGDEVTGALLWPLSTQEAYYMNSELRIANASWWLRSPGFINDDAAIVSDSGMVIAGGFNVTDDWYGSRPAFNFNLKSVIFTSAAEGGKSSGDVGAGSLKSVGTNGTNEWKMTVKDEAHKDFKADSVTTADGKTLTIKYSGAKKGDGEYISAVIRDKNGNIRSYGKLALASDAEDAEATVDIDGKMQEGDTLCVFNEQCNDDYETDFSSPLQPVYDAFYSGADVLRDGSNTSEAATVHMAGTKWRVIGYGVSQEGGIPQVASSADTMTLIAADNLKTGVQFNPDSNQVNTYKDSNLYNEVNALTADTNGLFSKGEKEGIVARDLAKGGYTNQEPYTNGIAGNKVENALLWPLSTQEAYYMDENLRAMNAYWWLRSPGNDGYNVAVVTGVGDVYYYGYGVFFKYGLRPAFNFNLKSVIFTSAAVGGKSSGDVGAGSLKSVEPNSNNEWKLTLESGHDNFKVENVSTCDGKTVNIKYSGAVAKKGEYISAIITDKNDAVKYYGNLIEFADEDSTSGTAKVTIEDKMEPTDKLYIFNEQLNGDKKTDYSSALSEITIPAAGHKYGAWTKLNATQHQRVCEHDDTHVEKANHTWDAGKVTKKATEKATGVRTYTCTVCKATMTETIPKLTPAPTPVPEPTNKKVSKQPSVKIKAGKKSLTLGWNKIKNAEGYDIFFARCNHSHKKIVCKKVKNIKGNNIFTWKKSGLKKGIAYKSYVKAYVYKDGKKKYVYKSPIMHAYTGNGNKKYTNAKSVSLKNVKKGKLTLKKGKTFKIKAKVKKVKKNKKLFPKNHVTTLRYMTSDKKIATVSSKGKIKAVAKGKCYIYAYAHNGVSKKVTVTVKR